MLARFVRGLRRRYDDVGLAGRRERQVLGVDGVERDVASAEGLQRILLSFVLDGAGDAGAREDEQHRGVAAGRGGHLVVARAQELDLERVDGHQFSGVGQRNGEGLRREHGRGVRLSDDKGANGRLAGELEREGRGWSIGLCAVRRGVDEEGRGRAGGKCAEREKGEGDEGE